MKTLIALLFLSAGCETYETVECGPTPALRIDANSVKEDPCAGFDIRLSTAQIAVDMAHGWKREGWEMSGLVCEMDGRFTVSIKSSMTTATFVVDQQARTVSGETNIYGCVSPMTAILAL